MANSTRTRSLLLALAVCLAAGGCREAITSTTLNGPTMGTAYSVKVVGLPDGLQAESLHEEIRGELERIDGLMSTWRPDSELSRLNRAAGGEWFDVSPDTLLVIQEAVRIGRLTGGAFDVTVAPLVDLWQFGPNRQPNDRVPPSDEIEAARQRVGLDKIELRGDPPGVKKARNDLKIELSAIAKGLAVDRVAERLEKLGVKDYMVEIGGEVRCRGRNAQGKPWQIAVESPLAGQRQIQRVIGLRDLSMATSGDYRNYFEQDGVRYSHLIDPRSGSPISHRLASVTVLDPSCMQADAMATALMVLGPEAGYELAVREKLAVLLIVNSDGGFQERATPRFLELIE